MYVARNPGNVLPAGCYGYARCACSYARGDTLTHHLRAYGRGLHRGALPPDVARRGGKYRSYVPLKRASGEIFC